MTLTVALALAGVVLLGAASPGPDFILVTRVSVARGRLMGVLCALGIGAGVVGWALAAALGIAGVIAASTVAFTVVKVLGACYLIYLGVRAIIGGWRTRRSVADMEVPGEEVGLSRRAALGQGFITNILNPKTAVFFVAMIPQFLPPTIGIESVFLFCAVAAGVVTGWYALVAVTVGSLARLFRSARFRSTLDMVSGFLLVGLGVRVATTVRAAAGS